LLTWGADVVVNLGDLFFASGGAAMPEPFDDSSGIILCLLPG